MEVSIVVPIYNAERYLRRCCDSILRQTFKDFELILVDDGSPDACGEICDEYAKMDSRVKVIHQPNAGLSKTRNAAIDLAQGRFIMFCDPDDYVAEDWVKELYEVIRFKPNASVNCCIAHINEDGTPRTTLQREINGGGGLLTTDYYYLHRRNLSNYTVNKIYNKAIIDDFHLRFDSKYIIGEDVVFNAEYFKKCNEILLINKTLYYYVFYPQSASNRYRQDKFQLLLPTYWEPLALISSDHLADYCDGWMWRFLEILDRTFWPENNLKFFAKLRYNNKMMHTKEFIHCAQNISIEKNGKLFSKILKLHNYYFLFLFQKVYSILGKSRK